MPRAPDTVPVLGYRIARLELEKAARWIVEAAQETDRPRLIVTLNPEIVVRAASDGSLRATLENADLTVADGVGLLWAARRQGQTLPGRVPGIDLVCRAMEMGGESLRVFFLGSKPGVALRAAENARQRWGVEVAGARNGYFEEPEEVVAQVGEARPHLLLAGLGEGQEQFLDRYRSELGARVMVGVGGTLDVLAGEARRTPQWTRRFNLEWAWRVGLDRRRWHRIPRLLQFVRLVRRREQRL